MPNFPILIEVQEQFARPKLLSKSVYNKHGKLPAPPNVWPIEYKVYQLAEDWNGVPKGFITDLASVPGLIDNAIPRDGLWRGPAVKHDWDYATKNGPRDQRDLEFYNGMIEYGTDPEWAGVMYQSVRRFGWIPWRRSTGVPDIRELYYEPR